MFFHVYGENSFYQFLGFILVFIGLILTNEFARYSPTTGFISFLGIPILITIYLFFVNQIYNFIPYFFFNHFIPKWMKAFVSSSLI